MITLEVLERAMQHAVDLATDPTIDPSPNPRVGCVLLSPTGDVVGAAAHRRAGDPHAEVLALAAAGDRARGAVAVVTLEPCSHTGRTGPCVDALLAAGVSSVAYAQADPNPEAGGGAERLRASGIEVHAGILEVESAGLNVDWTLQHARPRVTWKVAASLDGRVAAADLTSRWITSAEARQEVHRLRAEVDAVVVGTATVEADDPHLTAREGDDVVAAPLRVVVGHRELDRTLRVFDGTAPTLRLRTHDPLVVLAVLASRGVRTVLLEGGPTLAGAFVRSGAVDHVIWYSAPLLLGSGPMALQDAGVRTLADGVCLVVDNVSRVGADIRIDGRIAGR